MIQKLFLLCDGLTNNSNHHYEYAKSVYFAAKDEDISITVLSNVNVTEPIQKELGTKPVFTSNFQDRFFKIKFPLRVLNFLKEMKTGLSSEWDENSLCFIETTHSFHLAAIMLWDVISFRRSLPLFILLFRSDSSSMVRFFIRRLQSLINKNRIFLVTDSEIIAKDYQQQMGVSLVVLPIPHIPQFVARRKSDSSKKCIKFLIPLNGRGYQKGILTVLKTISLIKNLLKLGKIELILKCDSTGAGYMRSTDDTIDVRKKLIALVQKYENVKIIFESMSSIGYYDLLNSSDAVVLPFKLPFYRSGTSGVFAECVAAGKPVIVTEGTWMALEAKKLNTGLLIKEDDETDLANKINILAKNYAEFNKRAFLAAKKWGNFHNAKTFINILIKFRGIHS